MFKLSCPRCKAPPDDAQLQVTSGAFTAMGMHLYKDGFSTEDAAQFCTEDEQVHCEACDETFSLNECLDEEVNDG